MTRPRAGRRVLLLAAVLLVVLAGLLAAGTLAAPLTVDCPAGGFAEDVCRETADAGMRRGLTVPHPLLLSARVEPGPDSGPGEYGNRATVVYGLLGPPGSATVRLFYDVGGHWGGTLDRSDEELALGWAALPLMLVVAAGGMLILARRAGAQSGT